MKAFHNAFTLIELLVVLAILSVLAGIVYASTGPSREKARQAKCMGNLHQIGVALAMYRSDYDGNEAGNTPFQCGFPPGIDSVLPYLRGNEDVLHCPDVTPDKLIQFHGQRWTLYRYTIWWPEDRGNLPVWGDALRQRGDAFPIFTCMEHDFQIPDRPGESRYVLLLRLDTSTSARYVPMYSDGWTW